MPIFQAKNLKYVVVGEDKTRGLSIEYPHEMVLEEVLSKAQEFCAAVAKSLEEAKKASDAKAGPAEQETGEKV